ncbi:mediator complex protein [Ophiostoma piceae UAMH 11346]|uniref:Mediator of RNA polymerase II transcription subunit 11 n=1 Tax=Ophiostoma piceae (strain UAMH 11346) TaxID=1262450 RepID=S3CMS3_OPHP1|nr:mediator complex protein [Ophiostoma piceae UAMH 11346]
MDESQQDDAAGTQPSTDVHEPFTLAERFEQLDAIDNDIISLLSLANDTLRPLSKPIAVAGADLSTVPKDFSNPDAIDTEAQVSAFRDAMDGFLTTLHSVDVRLKRQIWALEEDGIISLKEAKTTGGTLEPNGVGDIGKLDVGYLNSRSSKVDRDMESELWLRLRTSLEKMGHVKSGQAGEASGMDIDK